MNNTKTRICSCLVFAVTFALFSPGLDHDFLNWDDTTLVVNAQGIRSLELDAIVRMFSTYCASNYTPLERLSYAVDYQLWGMNAAGFCLTNILLHSANTFLVFILVFQIFSRIFTVSSGASGACSSNGRLCLAASCAALAFAIHPLRVESVTWIAERRDVLSLFWLLLCMLAYLKWVDIPVGTSRRSWVRMAAWIFFVASLLSKAAGVTLPLVLILLDFYPLRRFTFSRNGLIPFGRCVLEKIPYFAVSLAVGWAAVFGQSYRGAVIGIDVYPWGARILNAFTAIAFYVHQWIFPFQLYPIYPKASRNISLFDIHVLLSVIWILLVSGWSILSIRRRPGFTVVWWSYVIMIFPFIGLLQVGNPFAADRYTYFSMIPFALLIGAGLYHGSNMGLSKRTWGLLVVGLSIVFGSWSILTIRQIDFWRNSLVFWPYVQREVPHEFNPLNNYSTALVKQGDYFLANVMSRETTRIQPRWDVGWHNYGVALFLTGRNEQAIQAFRRSLQLNPGAGDTHLILGNLLSMKNEGRAARRHYFASLQDQVTADRLTRLAIALYREGELELAMKYLAHAALEKYPEAYLVWAQILASQSHMAEALSILRLGYDLTHDPEIYAFHSKLLQMKGF